MQTIQKKLVILHFIDKFHFVELLPLKNGITVSTQNGTSRQEIKKRFPVFLHSFLAFSKMPVLLCKRTPDNAVRTYPALKGAAIHADRGTQYISETYRRAVVKYGILQSMNSAGRRCHDTARCESMWARMKKELLYVRHKTEKMTLEEVKTLIFRYFIGYWNNRRICSANKGLPPMVKRQRYYESLDAAA